MLETELAAEQAHLDRAYARLRVLQGRAIEFATAELAEHAPTPAALLERDAREAHGRRRFGSLRVDGGLCFGRIDRSDGDTFHIGRVGVAEEDLTPLVVDWRAPVAEAFYRATPLEPLGVLRRRHLLTRGRSVVGIEDEPLEVVTSAAARDDLVLVGEAALLGALTERRTGRMRDIVATIQAEQDRIIRSPLSGALIVEGGPGTGKTAVALHRAAFLLYKHRFPLEEQGVLVLGPNPLFLHYIERVLPSLGESRCRLATIDDVHRVRAGGPEADRETARVKGDVRMAEVVARAVLGRERRLPRQVVIGFGSFRLKIGAGSSERIIDAVQARRGTHNERRPFVERLVVRHLVRQYELAADRARSAGLNVERRTKADIEEGLRSSRDVRAVIERMWPALTAEDLLRDLFAHPPLLRHAVDGVLAPEEAVLLERPREASFTTSDLPLLDEADVLLGFLPTASAATAVSLEDVSAMVERVLVDQSPECPACDEELLYVAASGKWRCGTEGCWGVYEPQEVMSPEAAQWLDDLRRRLIHHATPEEAPRPASFYATYGHVVVDEAQELSPMQWRMLARRCPSRSMTLVGDLVQGSGPTAAARWADVFSALGTERGSVVGLTVNYRTPSEVMELADRLSPHATRARCVRDADQAPIRVRAGDLVTTAVSLARAEVDAVAGGKVAVIAPERLVDVLRERLDSDPAAALEGDVTVVGPEAAKGLEFDSVVVVEPAEFTERSLYVALTRTTTRLILLHQLPLPDALATSGSTR